MPLTASKKEAWILCATAFLTACVVVGGARYWGALDEPELAAYDALLRLRTPAPPDKRIVLIHETEDDLKRFGHPLRDELLASVLEKLELQEPAAIGVDKYRDIAVPPGTEALDAVLRKYNNIVWVFRFGTKAALIDPPAALKGTERAGFADLVDDPGGIIRRGLLLLDDGTTAYQSLALGVALQYLKPSGIAIGGVEGSAEAIQLGRARIDPLDAHDGGYAGADMGGFQFLLDYRSMPQPIESHTLSDAVDGKVQGLKGRIVLIGANAESLGDQVYTPFSKGRGARDRISGVELHGHIASQLVRLALGESRPLAAWGLAPQLAYAALWCALGLLLFIARGVSIVLGGAALGTVGIVAVSAGALEHASVWIPLVPALAGFLLTGTIAVAMRLARERRERVMVMSLFSKHVSPAVAREIWERKDEIVGGRGLKPAALTATVLFSDIRGFTPISEKLGPLGLAQWLEVYMRAMSQPTLDCNGLISKYIGDAIMALFGVPVPRVSREAIAADALNAVKAAMGMREALKRLNEQWKANGEPTAGTRIGIHTGEVITCSIGTADRQEYTVLGDVVNTAARLESFPAQSDAPPPECRILISAVTRELVKDHVETEPVGELELKGKSEKVFVYRVV